MRFLGQREMPRGFHGLFGWKVCAIGSMTGAFLHQAATPTNIWIRENWSQH